MLQLKPSAVLALTVPPPAVLILSSVPVMTVIYIVLLLAKANSAVQMELGTHVMRDIIVLIMRMGRGVVLMEQVFPTAQHSMAFLP